MKALVFALRSFGRELRSGEVIVLLSAVALAVAALTAVGFLTDRIGKAVARQANEVLAADLRLRSPDPVPDEWREAAERFGLQPAETRTFPSVVYAGNESSLATIKVVSETYPLRGSVRVSDRLFGEQREVDHIPLAGTVWTDGAAGPRAEDRRSAPPAGPRAAEAAAEAGAAARGPPPGRGSLRKARTAPRDAPPCRRRRR